MSYSFAFISSLSSEQIINLINHVDPNYKSQGLNMDVYSLVYIAANFKQLPPEDLSIFQNPKFADLYFLSNEQLLQKTQGISNTSKLNLIKQIIINHPVHSILPSRLSELIPGKVLNVSSIKANGTGTRIINKPTKGKLKGVDTLPIVSDNLNSYIIAINMIPNGPIIYNREIEQIKTIFSPSPSSSPPRIEEAFDDNYRNLDLFDFNTYQEDYLLFAQYFRGVELYLRTGIWISYKYGRLDNAERIELMSEFNGKQNKKDWLEIMTDVFEPQQLIYSWIKHFNPNILNKFNKIYNNYQYYPDFYFNRAYKRYIDQNADFSNLWF